VSAWDGECAIFVPSYAERRRAYWPNRALLKSMPVRCPRRALSRPRAGRRSTAAGPIGVNGLKIGSCEDTKRCVQALQELGRQPVFRCPRHRVARRTRYRCRRRKEQRTTCPNGTFGRCASVARTCGARSRQHRPSSVKERSQCI
jgi:hypothetical protein